MIPHVGILGNHPIVCPVCDGKGHIDFSPQPGDRVYYRKTGGWGGGQTTTLIALVAKVHTKRATIALWSLRSQNLGFKRVALDSLDPRESEHEVDKYRAAVIGKFGRQAVSK